MDLSFPLFIKRGKDHCLSNFEAGLSLELNFSCCGSKYHNWSMAKLFPIISNENAELWVI